MALRNKHKANTVNAFALSQMGVCEGSIAFEQQRGPHVLEK